MAMQIEGTEKRGNIYYLKPEAIQVDWTANGRFTKPTAAELEDLKASIKLHGQQQPVMVRTVKTDAGQQAVLVAGFCRVEAIRQLNEESPSTPILVACSGLPRVNDEDAFRLNVEENMRRKVLTPLDIAYSIRRWEQVYHKGADEIAAIYQRPVRWVHEHKKLLVLDSQTAQEVHTGAMTMSAALDLAAMPEEKRKEVKRVLAESKQEEQAPQTTDKPAKAAKTKNRNGKTDRAAVVAAARQVGVKRARNWKDLKTVLDAVQGRSEVAKVILSYMAGEADDAALLAALKAN